MSLAKVMNTKLPISKSSEEKKKLSIASLQHTSRFGSYVEIRDLLPLDGAVALPKVAEQLGLQLVPISKFVATPFGGGTRGIPFSRTTKTFYNGDTVVVPWGRYAVKRKGKLLGGIDTAADENDGIPCFSLWGSLPDDEWNALTRALDAFEGGLYKGKAFRMKFGAFGSVSEPEEIRTTKKSPIFLLPDVQASLDASLFAPIQHRQLCRDIGIAVRRNILLEGGYGTGKSLTAAETARLAVEHGWTYILLPHAQQGLSLAMKMAQKLAPSVLFVEDIDAVMGGTRDGSMNAILNTLDGIESKDKEVITVFTTNFSEDLDPAFLRPGRLDAIVTLLPLDTPRVMEMIQHFTGLTCPLAGEQLNGASPAIVKEAIDRAKLFSITTSQPLSEGLILSCASQLERQRQAMAPKKSAQETRVEEVIARAIARKLQGQL